MRRSEMLLAVVLSCLCAGAPAPERWRVHPEWVRAHEEFLAADALQGRGSASRDEQIAATYVGSEFLSFGLTTAPGMSGYVQRVEVEKPELDGHATVTAGTLQLHQGADFYLLMSSGGDVVAPLQKISAPEANSQSVRPHSVVLLPAGAGVGGRFRSADAILVGDNDRLKAMHQRFGGKPLTRMRVKGAKGAKGAALLSGMTTAVFTKSAMARLAGLRDGTKVRLSVHRLDPAPRYTYNAIGYQRGSDPAAGTILITAHLDHLGVGMPQAGDAIYNGADDDASGTTAVLELARAFAATRPTRRSLLFVCFGAEEEGGIGSDYFRNHPPVPLKDIVANIEFEMIGAQDPKTPKGDMFLSGWDRSNLGPTLRAHGARIGPDPYPEQNFFARSDNYALALKGVVAQTVAGWGMPPYYHQPNDDMQHLDLAFMTAAIQSVVEPLRWLADTNFVPQWNPGKQPK